MCSMVPFIESDIHIGFSWLAGQRGGGGDEIVWPDR